MKMASMGVRTAALCVAAFLLAGCEDRFIKTTGTVDREYDFNIDSDAGVLFNAGSLTRAELLDELDLPSDAVVTRVAIESARLFVQAGAGNTASQAAVTASYQRDGEAPLDLTGTIDVPLLGVYDQPLQNMLSPGVNQAKADVMAMLLNSVGAPSIIRFGVTSASRTPSNSRLVMEGFVRVRLSVSFGYCLSFPTLGPPDNDPECD
jgi:hypothetical protein